MNWISHGFQMKPRKFGNHKSLIGNTMDYLIVVNRNGALTIAIIFSAKRITYTRFHPETGYRKHPINPVNPVYFKN